MLTISLPPFAALTSLLILLVPLFVASATTASRRSRKIAETWERSRGPGSHDAAPATAGAENSSSLLGLGFIYDIIMARGPEEKYLAWTCEQFRCLGRTYSMRSCVWETVFTSDSRNIKHMLAGGAGGAFDDFALPRLRVDAIATLLGTGIFGVNGAAWAHARAVLRPCLMVGGSGGSSSVIVDVLEGHFQRFLRHVPRRQRGSEQDDSSSSSSSDGGHKVDVVVDLQPLFFALAMDFATQFLAGKSSDMLRQLDDEEDFHGNKDNNKSSSRSWGFFHDYAICSQEVIRKMCLGPLQVFRYSRAAQQAKKRVFQYMDDFIAEALQEEEEKEKQGDSEENGGRNTSRTVLARLASDTPDPRALRDQMLHLLVASRDTTAGLLSNLFFVLAKDPAAYARLRHEVVSVCGEEVPPRPEQLKEMNYLRWCVQESLRLHPVIPTNARQATRDTTLPVGGGADGCRPLQVNKGTLVVYNVFAMHRDEAVFGPDAHAFRPERWAAAAGLRPGWGYLPFNGGPRICLGQKIALLEAHYLIARMVQTFTVLTSQESRDWEELFGLAISCKHGVKVQVSWA